ncbi:GLE1-like protein-domain-containing protein [Panaeolus papilionaceus]|nr:GLE1-like protein-domain-containing protein [Panaeolus papilionaceus]
MRFGVPRSYSPSPERSKPRHASTFGLQSDSDSEDYDVVVDSSDTSESDDNVSIASSTSSESSFILSMNISKMSLRPERTRQTPLEDRNLEDTIAAIRLRTRHHDPYEEWEKQTRKDAFRTARKQFSMTQTNKSDEQEKLRLQEQQRLAAIQSHQNAEIQNKLAQFKQQQLQVENELRSKWQVRERELWNKVEASIRQEEEKLAKKLEAERQAREAEEKKRKEEEMKRRLIEEKRLQEETARKREEEERKREEEEKERQEKELEEKMKKLEEERERRLGEEQGLRDKLQFYPPENDWRAVRANLLQLKGGPIAAVKSNKETKSDWLKLRRQIVPKIGQLTNDQAAIQRITQQLIEIARPPSGPLNPMIYATVLGSIAKAILLQAETEVTAEKNSAVPLAQVAYSLLDSLEHFPEIFLGRLIQRCGGWPIPIFVGDKDHDKNPWSSKEERIKAAGYRKSESGSGLESAAEHSNRISSMLRVYFHILKIPPKQPQNAYFALPRYWTWFARVLSDFRLLADPIAPQLIYTGLDVLGKEAKVIWGQQWIKVLALLHEGLTTGYQHDLLIGGNSAEAAAARSRALLSLESIMA